MGRLIVFDIIILWFGFLRGVVQRYGFFEAAVRRLKCATSLTESSVRLINLRDEDELTVSGLAPVIALN